MKIAEYKGIHIYNCKQLSMESYLDKLHRFVPAVVLSDSEYTLLPYFHKIVVLGSEFLSVEDAQDFIDLHEQDEQNKSHLELIKTFYFSVKYGNKRFIRLEKDMYLNDLENKALLNIENILSEYLDQLRYV